MLLWGGQTLDSFYLVKRCSCVMEMRLPSTPVTTWRLSSVLLSQLAGWMLGVVFHVEQRGDGTSVGVASALC